MSHQHVVCFSGGHSSALVAVEVVRRYGPLGVVLLNHDINARVEDQDVKRFKAEVARYLGLRITYANHARVEEWDQFDVVEHAKAFKVRTGQELCTARLKSEPFMAWLKTYAPPGTATIYYGFDANERTRIQRRSSIMAAAGYKTDYPLALWRHRTITSTREVGIEPPLTYGRFKHANCTGCLKAGWQHWYVVYATRRDIWERAKLAEERIGHSIHQDAYLHEREEEFARMLEAGVDPTEQVQKMRFWSQARKAVKSLPVLAEEKDDRPCECVFRKRGKARPSRPVCDCGAAPNEPHTLSCAWVFGEAALRRLPEGGDEKCWP